MVLFDGGLFEGGLFEGGLFGRGEKSKKGGVSLLVWLTGLAASLAM
jgi:hypothetical protein